MNRLERAGVRHPDPMLPRSRHQSMKALLQKADTPPAPPRWWVVLVHSLLRLFQP